MITMEQINGEISVLEEETPTFSVMQKLADLYTVRDHMVLAQQPQGVITVDSVPDTGSGSEFCELVTGCDVMSVMAVMDELMQTLGLINRRLYDCVIQKLRDRV